MSPQLSGAQESESKGATIMETDPADWQPARDFGGAQPSLHGLLEWAHSAAMEPRLMASANGAQAVLLRCRPFSSIVAELIPTGDSGGRGLLSSLGCGDGWLAVLNAVPDRGTGLLVEALVHVLEGEGRILDAVATIGDGPGAVPPGLAGFEPIADARVGDPDLLARIMRQG